MFVQGTNMRWGSDPHLVCRGLQLSGPGGLICQLAGLGAEATQLLHSFGECLHLLVQLSLGGLQGRPRLLAGLRTFKWLEEWT